MTSDDKYIISGSWDKSLKIWDVKNRKCVQVYEQVHSCKLQNPLINSQGGITGLAISKGNKHVISAGGYEGKPIKIFSLLMPEENKVTLLKKQTLAQVMDRSKKFFSYVKEIVLDFKKKSDENDLLDLRIKSEDIEG